MIAVGITQAKEEIKARVEHLLLTLLSRFE
jgi:hypothetical protein